MLFMMTDYLQEGYRSWGKCPLWGWRYNKGYFEGVIILLNFIRRGEGVNFVALKVLKNKQRNKNWLVQGKKKHIGSIKFAIF